MMMRLERYYILTGNHNSIDVKQIGRGRETVTLIQHSYASLIGECLLHDAGVGNVGTIMRIIHYTTTIYKYVVFHAWLIIFVRIQISTI